MTGLNYDIIFTGVGILLILAGLFLFVSGKHAGSQNKIEAFGVKMDVSNPSLVLVIFGILLLLTIRVVSDDKNNTPQSSITPSNRQQTQVPQQTTLPQTQATTPEINSHNETMEPEVRRQAAPPRTVTAPPQVPALPPLHGSYQLVTYIEDGMQINANGQLLIETAQGQNFPFTATLQAYSEWGNLVSIRYTGYIAMRNGQWFIKINSATDPEWIDLGEVNMTMLLDGNAVGMRYYYDADISIIWQKQNAMY